MAAALDQKDECQSQNLSCTLCKDKSKKPKLLPCQHSFCSQCLIQHHGEMKEKSPLCCPSCQTNLGIDVDEVDSLPDNYLCDIVKDAYGGMESTEMKCTSCSQVEKVTNATHKCLDCSDTLCQNCNEWHCRTILTKHHIVIPFRELKEEKFKKEFSTRKVLFCCLHSTDEKKVPLSGYCDECDCLVCTKCTQNEHKGHHFKDIHVAREEKQASSSEDFTNLQQSEKDQHKRIMNIEHSITDTKQKWMKHKTEIYDKATEIFTIVDRIKDEKLAELRSHYEKELRYLNDLLEEEKGKQSSLQSTLVFAREFLEHCSDSDFLCHKKDVKTRMESQRRKVHQYIRKDLDIEKQDVETLVPGLRSVFGEMMKTERMVRHKCRVGKISTLFSKTVNIGSIYGIAFNAVTKELLLSGIQSYNGSLLVLDHNGDFRRFISCDEGVMSDDLCVKGHDIFLTFYMKQNQRFVIIDGDDKVKKNVRLPDDDLNADTTVSIVVDKGNTVFVGSSNTGRIYKLNQDGDTLLPFLCKQDESKLRGVQHLCLTPADQLVVSNRSQAKVQVYSKDGNLEWEYNDHSLFNASGLFCDDDGYIYVSDNKSHRIKIIRDNELVGIVPLPEEVEEFYFVPLLLTPEGDLIYGIGNKLVKISFWE